MALVTYLIRALPLVLWKKEIKNKYIKSFPDYVPYACLGTMTFPAILYATANIYSGIAGFVVPFFVAYQRKGSLATALAACITVFIPERLMYCF